MWKLLGNIFSSVKGEDVISRIDDWNLTKEETVKYQLEWLRTLPTGFQLAQRFIGIAFCIVFLVMVLVTFVMLTLRQDIDHLIDYISLTMMNPIMIIFSLFFGGGLINSFKKKIERPLPPPISEREKEKEKIQPVLWQESDEALEEELTRREKRRLARKNKKDKDE